MRFFPLIFYFESKSETLFIAILYKYHKFHNTVNKIASIERISRFLGNCNKQGLILKNELCNDPQILFASLSVNHQKVKKVKKC